jgi:adenylyltransferase/sulfurtransferase
MNFARVSGSAVADKSRYICQETYPAIGPGGQKRLARSRVLIVGCGALGSALSALMARAGVGFIRLVDPDFPALHNLQRQILYTEEDVSSGLPKALLARQHLLESNSSIEVEARVVRLERENVLQLTQDVDLILDGVDNVATRYLMSEASVKTGIPWAHGGVVGSRGNAMLFRPGETACFHCLFPEPQDPSGVLDCETAGILGPAAMAVASVQAAEALKWLVGDTGSLIPGMLTLDLWEGRFRLVDVGAAKRWDCPCCERSIFKHLPT